ncbi:hypothetical protein HYW46_02720 [Candidatus Daviesbacteria bacterium]|nr:hypothetical protein [Candidatus Daviesbacteria bacterium]
MSESLVGATTIEAAKFVVGQNPQIANVFYRKYVYVPAQLGKDEMIPVSRENFLRGLDPKILIFAEETQANIALDSRVNLLDGAKGHLLMMDLTLSKGLAGLQTTEERLRSCIIPHFGGGFLMETGQSYHFLGNQITNQEGWINFLGRCLVTSEVTKDKGFIEVADTRYIGFSLLRGSNGLRLTTRGTKSFIPRVVAIL